MRVHLPVRFALSACWLLLVVSFVAAQIPAANSSAAKNTNSDNTIRLDTQVVSFTVSVTDKAGHPITGLEQAAFQLHEDNVAQEISYFSYSDQPLSVGIVFDLSGSMGREKLQRAKDALKSFAATCHERDELALVGFNERAWLVGERLLAPEALTNAFGMMTARGQTALYDAVALGLTQVAKGRQPRKVLIIVSDGEDNRSRANFKTIRRLAQESDATIYAVGIQDFTPLQGYGKFILEELADLTGGHAFFPYNGAELHAAFDQIAVALRQQYSVGYVPTSFQADGKLRRIKLKVDAASNGTHHGKAVVRYRTGYVATGKGPADDVRADN